MAKWAQGQYIVKNTKKYIGKGIPKYRSGWELQVMLFLDDNASIQYWASESIVIPYKNPLTGKMSNYIPDFFVVYQNRHSKQIAEILEVKPKSQTSLTEAKSRHDQLAAVINQAKWAAASAYCNHHGFIFRIITEENLFHTGGIKKKR